MNLRYSQNSTVLLDLQLHTPFLFHVLSDIGFMLRRGFAMLAEQAQFASTCQKSALEKSSIVTLPPALQRLGNRFSADLVDLLTHPQTNISRPPTTVKPAQKQDDPIRTMALIRVRDGNIQGAIDLIQRHAPHEVTWLNTHLPRHLQVEIVAPPKPTIVVVPELVLVDPELARLTKIIGQFGLFRAWAYAHAIDDGDGRVDREPLESIWQQTQIATSTRHARRLIQQGIENGYWTQDARTKRIYLAGQVSLANKLVQYAIREGYAKTLTTNRPGKKRISLDLSGSMQQAIANAYAGWMQAKDQHGRGVTISRQTLGDLWDASLPTLLRWEAISDVQKQANYAQQNDTRLDSAPAYAYLTLNRDGSQSVAWRMPNTYRRKTAVVQANTGKSRRIQQQIHGEIEVSKQRGLIGDAALLRLGRTYFFEDAKQERDSFQVLDAHLRHVSRDGGDVFRRRYFVVGARYGVRIFEPYNIQTNRAETTLQQRLIWQETQEIFLQSRAMHRRMLVDHHDYLALFA